MMNKRGSVIALSIVFGIVFIIVGLMSTNFIKDEVTSARSADALDCNNASITDGNKLACLGVDIVVPYFIWIILGFAFIIIVGRLMNK